MNKFLYYDVSKKLVMYRNEWHLPENFTGMIETPDKSRFWYKNGLWHKEDGPARILVAESYPGYNRFTFALFDKEIKGVSSIESFKLYIDLLKLKDYCKTC